MSAPSTKTAYSSEQASDYDETRFADRSGQAVHQLELDMVLAAVTGLPMPSDILEVGCGTGRILTEINKLGHNIEGADASPSMLEQLKLKLPAVKLTVAGAADLPHESETFDAAYAVRLLNQTESEEYALSIVPEMLRVVKPGAPVLIEFINRSRPSPKKNLCVSLTHKEVENEAVKAGAEVLWSKGVFALGMSAIHKTPDPLVSLVASVDRKLAAALPTMCSRGYVLMRKKK